MKGELEKKYEEIVKREMPYKRSVSSCVKLLCRINRKKAIDPKSAVSTSSISLGIKGAHKHLRDMQKAGLIELRSKEQVHVFMDEANPSEPFVFGASEIERIRKIRLSELVRHLIADPAAMRVALESVSASGVEDLSKKAELKDSIFNKIVDSITLGGLRDQHYAYGKIGWRTGSHLWYLSRKMVIA